MSFNYLIDFQLVGRSSILSVILSIIDRSNTCVCVRGVGRKTAVSRDESQPVINYEQ